ncbi:MAG: hypothetical protein MJ252_17880 [archaeon]|nr:hypothetical protein [archaeon]
MNSTKSSTITANPVNKMECSIERMSNMLNRCSQRQRKRAHQPFYQKYKNYLHQSPNAPISQINVIPKRVRAKNNCSRKLLWDNFNSTNEKSSSKKWSEDNESESDCSYSSSRIYRKDRNSDESKTNSFCNYPTRKQVGLNSSEENYSDNSVTEENYSMEIERILIEIYNKNIKNIHNNNGKRSSTDKIELIQGEEEVRIYFKIF